MRIGILTLHSNYNYGAALQSYALYTFITSLGHEVEILNYRPKYLASTFPKLSLNPLHPVNAIRYNIKRYPHYLRKYIKFSRFERKVKLTKKVITSKELSTVANDFDIIVFGSDQIWCNLFNQKESLWYGDLGGEKTVKLSYAASAGDANFSNEELRTIVPQLNKFRAISVREEKLYNILRPRVDLKIPMTCTIDPSLMVNPKLWGKWYAPIRKDKYLVVRMARNYPDIYKIAEGLASQLNCNIVNVDLRESSFKSGYDTRAYSPEEFVSIIKNAECVLTNSFHGTAFSVITETPFYTIMMGDQQDERSKSFLQTLGLTDRMIEKDTIPQFKTIDFKNANIKLNELRNQSQQFLSNNIK